ncbi:UNVERIFIED_CONTAM: NADH-ubiquinone oxidoreductase chain 5 [Sesamum calycinum]|uniref:NADH-ubiquinone oxidoreductase chain 5 n=1 Tax=Sesamum calycinum TaxID=2727403 RepID=A0AAW2JK35_9LAMI
MVESIDCVGQARDYGLFSKCRIRSEALWNWNKRGTSDHKLRLSARHVVSLKCSSCGRAKRTSIHIEPSITLDRSRMDDLQLKVSSPDRYIVRRNGALDLDPSYYSTLANDEREDLSADDDNVHSWLDALNEKELSRLRKNFLRNVAASFKSFLRFGYEVSFEALDKGAIEILGPYECVMTRGRLPGGGGSSVVGKRETRLYEPEERLHSSSRGVKTGAFCSASKNASE